MSRFIFGGPKHPYFELFILKLLFINNLLLFINNFIMFAKLKKLKNENRQY